MSDALLPCPFCGGEAEIDPQQSFAIFGGPRRGQIAKRIAVYCLNCTADISICLPDVPDATPEMVIEMWNTRATLQQQASRLDAADKLVERLVETLQQCHAAIDPINHIHLYKEAQEKFGKRILYANDLLPILDEAAKWREGK